MATDRWIRASDQDRENAAELLSEAYAAGRLSLRELDERAAEAYSARTWGELRGLTADLPLPAARTGLPAGIVASRCVPRGAGRGWIGPMVWIFVLVLVGGLAGLVTPAAVWVVAALIPIALLLLPALGNRWRLTSRVGVVR